MWEVVIKNSEKSDLKKLRQSNLKAQFLAIVAQLEQNPCEPNQSFEKLVPPQLTASIQDDLTDSIVLSIKLIIVTEWLKLIMPGPIINHKFSLT
jgi:hypothetical protein